MKASPRSIAVGLSVAAVLAISSVAVATAASPAPVVGGPAGNSVCLPQREAFRASASVETLRAFGDCEINRRFATLDTLSGKVSSSKVLSSTHAAALTGEINSTRGGLTALKARIDSETDLTALKADIRRIATDFRVYVLVVPQANLTIGADSVAAAQPKFADINTKLSDAIATVKAAGKDTTAAQSHLDAMNAAVAQAVSLTSGIPDRVLPLTPAQWNAGTAGPVLTDARAKLVQARGQLRTAVQAAKACRDALKQLLPPKATATP
jgi:hypothetical protein